MMTLVKVAEAYNMLGGDIIGFKDTQGREPIKWPSIRGATEEIPIN